MKSVLFIAVLSMALPVFAQAKNNAEKYDKTIYTVLANHVRFPTDCGLGECHIEARGLTCFQTNDGRSTDCQAVLAIDQELRPYNFNDEPARYVFHALKSLGVKPVPVGKVQKMISLKRLHCERKGTGQEIPFSYKCEFQ